MLSFPNPQQTGLCLCCCKYSGKRETGNSLLPRSFFGGMGGGGGGDRGERRPVLTDVAPVQ